MKKIFYVLLLILMIKVLNNNVELINNLIDNTIMMVQSSGFTYFVLGMSVIIFDKYIKKVYQYIKSKYKESKKKYLNETKR
ncbi:MAG: hypothetical protein ACOCP8_06865 [archaeon]